MKNLTGIVTDFFDLSMSSGGGRRRIVEARRKWIVAEVLFADTALIGPCVLLALFPKASEFEHSVSGGKHEYDVTKDRKWHGD
ncbi:hypothetical protein MFFC18_50910 [Mariniblastus fucicola]|uniref:Uncharacterized protein n=1 Tax=Mariniblastus fucicola TaxID=980251 RepID=A0A5B9PEL7_9BACT|nr:hypothetical protein MFFC18_50910 [Mariniblastus fucicola]